MADESMDDPLQVAIRIVQDRMPATYARARKIILGPLTTIRQTHRAHDADADEQGDAVAGIEVVTSKWMPEGYCILQDARGTILFMGRINDRG